MSGPENQPASADITIYRAVNEFASMVLGHYTNPAAAREHCVAMFRRHQPHTAVEWEDSRDSSDPEDYLDELVVPDPDGKPRLTGYLVTALTIASAYDEEADE